MIIELKTLKELVSHSFQSPIPVDVKIGNEFASIKIYRSGDVYVKKYVPVESFNIDISLVEGESDTTIDNYISKEINSKIASNETMVAVVNSKLCTIRKIGDHTTILLYIRPKYEFDTEINMLASIKETILTLR